MHLIKSVFLLLTLSILISSCGYEELTSAKKNTLTVASDYLSVSDSILFSDFTKKTGVKVKIIHLEIDSILKKVLNDPLNAGFDMIMVSKTPILKELQSKKLLQKFSDSLDYSQSNRYFLYTGIDPIVFYANRNINYDSLSYTNLSESFWFTHLNNIDLKRLFNCIKQENKWSSRESALWIRQVEQKRISYPIVDSLAPLMFNVGFLSELERKSQFNDTLNTFPYLFFPNQIESGLFYSLYGSGIVYQSANFSAAMDLIIYLSQVSNAELINNKIGIVSFDRKSQMGIFKNKRVMLNPKTIDDFKFDLNWWNAHIGFARNMKIDVKKPVAVTTAEITDTLKLEN